MLYVWAVSTPAMSRQTASAEADPDAAHPSQETTDQRGVGRLTRLYRMLLGVVQP
jgi:hypothetical protein